MWFDAEFVKAVESKGERVTIRKGAQEPVKVHVVQ
jgi:hypothetical protein